MRHSPVQTSLAALMILAAALSAQPGAQASDNKALETAIHDYIMTHPEVIQESLTKAHRSNQLLQTKRILREQRDAIYHAGSPTLGAADAKVSIVTFYDYNCPYCRMSYAEIRDFVRKHADSRIVLKDIAYLSKESEDVAKIIIAAAKQGKVLPLHDALMSRKGRNTEAVALQLAGKLGFDVERLKKEAASSATAAALQESRELATTLSIDATPIVIIGHNAIAGVPPDLTAQLDTLADQIRKSGCDVC